MTLTFAQQPAPGRKPPVGVPVEAKFFNGKWYHIYFEKTSWPKAQQKCVALGGRLAIVSDEATWEFIKALSKDASLWLGATDEKTEGVWKWTDGTPMALKHWYEGQPDNANGAENFLSTHRGFLNDAPKNGEYVPHQFVTGFICEWRG